MTPAPPTPSSSHGASSLRDDNEDLGLDPATPTAAARLIARALTLRCPACGGGPVLRHWLAMREQCGNCGLALERGERDYFIGSMMWNLVLSEFLFVGAFIGALVWQWPQVNWTAIQVIAPVGTLLTPFVLFPFSKLIWLAFDLILRPERRGQRALKLPHA
ncbi:MAG: DUF983 domain-containing protein [Gemmatimonadaceae bacterium]